jgi:hypothetical protein
MGFTETDIPGTADFMTKKKRGGLRLLPPPKKRAVS